MQYRADIDGLRAIAVLAVVLFHLKLEVFSGGFVGVDVFFVISGFLITTIIRQEIEQKTFSFVGFYERRFRRILPAMFVMLVSVLIVSSFLFDPAKYQTVGESAVSTLLFGANVYFEHAVGYFDTHAETKPLLHMWSLGVEEQFYIFLPFLLIFLHSRMTAPNVSKLVFAILVISFVAASFKISHKPTEVFYLLHFRAWELLAGSLLAYLKPLNAATKASQILSLLGLFLIVSSVLGFDSKTPFPGPFAMVPVLGASLIIWAGHSGNFVSRVLSLKLLVWFGLISYSLYLWHWPVIAFAEQLALAGYELTQPWLLFGVSTLFAYLSWRLVETPVRRKTAGFSPQRIVMAGGMASAMLIILSSMVIFSSGLPQRLYGSELTAFNQDGEVWQHWNECERRSKNMRSVESLCSLGEKNAEVSVVVWGDSHAISMAPAIDAALKRNGIKGVFIARNGCPPLLQTGRLNKPACLQFNDAVAEYVDTHSNLTAAMLVSRWSVFATGQLYGQSEKVIHLVDHAEQHGDALNLEVFERGLERTVDVLAKRGMGVMIVEQVPETYHDVPSISYLANQFSKLDLRGFMPKVTEFEARQSGVTAVFSRIAKLENVRFFAPAQFLCSSGYCEIALENTPLYTDDNHLSVAGAEMLSLPLTRFIQYEGGVTDDEYASGTLPEKQ